LAAAAFSSFYRIKKDFLFPSDLSQSIGSSFFFELPRRASRWRNRRNFLLFFQGLFPSGFRESARAGCLWDLTCETASPPPSLSGRPVYRTSARVERVPLPPLVILLVRNGNGGVVLELFPPLGVFVVRRAGMEACPFLSSSLSSPNRQVFQGVFFPPQQDLEERGSFFFPPLLPGGNRLYLHRDKRSRRSLFQQVAEIK